MKSVQTIIKHQLQHYVRENTILSVDENIFDLVSERIEFSFQYEGIWEFTHDSIIDFLFYLKVK